MGSSSSIPPIDVVIIDGKKSAEDHAFDQILNSKVFKCSQIYENYASCRQKQIFKNMSYVIIRQKQEFQNKQIANSIQDYAYDHACELYEQLSKKNSLIKNMKKLEEEMVQGGMVKGKTGKNNQVMQLIASEHENIASWPRKKQQMKRELNGWDDDKNNVKKVKRPVSAKTRSPLIREQFINYIQKYSLEKLSIYILVADEYSYKISQSQEPYIALVASNINTIMRHILKNKDTKKQQSAKFKFNRLLRDLNKRTVVRIFQDQNNKQASKEKNEKNWRKLKQLKISKKIQALDEENFKTELTSAYYDYIVVNNKKELDFVMDQKNENHLSSKIILYLNSLSLQQISNQKSKVKSISSQLSDEGLKQLKSQKELPWMTSGSQEQIEEAISKCTDSLSSQFSGYELNIVVFTQFDQIAEEEKMYLKEQIQKFAKNKKKQVKIEKIHVACALKQLRGFFLQSTFSFFITFDCTFAEIEEIKNYLREIKVHNRVYIYSADEKQGQVEKIKKMKKQEQKKKTPIKNTIKQYLEQRIKEVGAKAKFQIKFQYGPLEKITTFGSGWGEDKCNKSNQRSQEQLSQFNNAMTEAGIITYNIPSPQVFQDQYLMNYNTYQRRYERISVIEGFCLVLKVDDLQTWEKFIKLDCQRQNKKNNYLKLNKLSRQDQNDKNTYLRNIKIIVFDTEKNIADNWKKLKEKFEKQQIHFISYKLSKVISFAEIMIAPKLELSIFIKKALPNFIKQYKAFFKDSKLIDTWTQKCSFSVKSNILKEVFDDKLQLSKSNQISFLWASFAKQQIEMTLTLFQRNYLPRYSNLWKAGFRMLPNLPSTKEFYQIIEILHAQIQLIQSSNNSQQSQLSKSNQKQNTLGQSKFKSNSLAQSYSDTIKKFMKKFKNQQKFAKEKDISPWRNLLEMIKNREIKNRKQNCINAIKEDLKSCFYKCRSYRLLDVSKDKFEELYINRIQNCNTYIDLQIALIYIISLPHGLFNILKFIFMQPKLSIMAPKVFVGLVVMLLFCFYNFEDEVISKEKFVLFLDEQKKQQNEYQKIKINDILFNKTFMVVGKSRGYDDLDDRNCLFIQFENVPMLQKTSIKYYVNMHRFSFYKENFQYLISPFTKFKVTKRQKTVKDKMHITLTAQSNSFIESVLNLNNFDEQLLYKYILDEVDEVKDNAKDLNNLKKIKSLYNRVQLLQLNSSKKQFVNSIKQGYYYIMFHESFRERKYFEARSYLIKKQRVKKNTTEIQANRYKAMLRFQKSLLNYKLGEYNLSVKELNKLNKYLDHKDQKNKWVLQKINSYKSNIIDLVSKKEFAFDKFEKVKEWTIEANVKDNKEAKDSKDKEVHSDQIITFKSRKPYMQWKVQYNNDYGQFCIQMCELQLSKPLHNEQDQEDYQDQTCSLEQRLYQIGQKIFFNSELPQFGESVRSTYKKVFLLQSDKHKKKEEEQKMEKKVEKKFRSKQKVQQEGSQSEAADATMNVIDLMAQMEKTKKYKFELIWAQQYQKEQIQKTQKKQKPNKDEEYLEHQDEKQEEEYIWQNSGNLPIKTVSRYISNKEVKQENLPQSQSEQSSIVKVQAINLKPKEAQIGIVLGKQYQAFYFNRNFILTQKKHFKRQLKPLRHY